MTGKINIFDRKLLKNNRQRFLKKFSQYDFLHKEIAERLIEKIPDFSEDFENILELGARDGYLGQKISQLKNAKFLVQSDLCPQIIIDNKHSYKIAADDEFLCLKEQSFDLVISNLNLHFINDIQNNLLQIKNILKNGGRFIASFFGGQTLKELREVFYQIEIENYSGITPRIIPFIDVKDAGMLMQKAGFIDSVAEIEKITVFYQHPLKLLQDLKNMSEGNILFARSKKFMSRKILSAIEKLYQKLFSNSEKGIDASFEIITVTGKI